MHEALTCLMSVGVLVFQAVKDATIFTARVRSTREGTVFTGVCLSTLVWGGGGLVPHPRSGQGVPHFQVRMRGIPFPGLDRGYPDPGPGQDGGTPSHVWTEGHPHPRYGWERPQGTPPPCTGQLSGQDGGYPGVDTHIQSRTGWVPPLHIQDQLHFRMKHVSNG